MKNVIETSLKKKNVILIVMIIIYCIISSILLILDIGDIKTGEYSMNTEISGGTQVFTETPVYRQYFSTNKDVIGIKLRFATNKEIAGNDILLSVYESGSDNFLGSQIISRDTIEDNEKSMVLFDDFQLNEGCEYYFEISSVQKTGQNVLCWMGTLTSLYAQDLICEGVTLEDQCLDFDLVYRRIGSGFVIWIFFTIAFLVVLAFVLDIFELRRIQVVYWVIVAAVGVMFVLLYAKLIY